MNQEMMVDVRIAKVEKGDADIDLLPEQYSTMDPFLQVQKDILSELRRIREELESLNREAAEGVREITRRLGDM